MKKSLIATALAAAALLLSGCGGGADAAPEASPAASTSTAATTGAGMGLGGASQDGPEFAAFQQCLSDAGISMPERGSGTGTGARPSMSAEDQAAFEECRALMPAGTGVPGGMQSSEEFQAFSTCMADQGVTVTLPQAGTTPSARPSAGTGGGNSLFGLDREDPEVAAALEVCEVLLPQRTAPQNTTP